MVTFHFCSPHPCHAPLIPKTVLSSRKFSVSARKIESLVRISSPILQCFQKVAPSPEVPAVNQLDSLNSSQKAARLSEFRHNHPPKCANLHALCQNAALFAAMYLPLPAFADGVEETPMKINVEQILISIDDFFNRNPFFVAGCTFIWLVVIPLTQEYLKKCKAISALDAFRKIKDVPEAQLLDIRKRKSVKFMNSPNLKILNKSAALVEFNEGSEEEFVKEVLKIFDDPGSTIICVLDNFDGDSLKVAELLFKNGFKEAYAIKGGLRGKDGWQATQETYFPPSVHVFARKKKRKLQKQSEANVEVDEKGSNNGPSLTLPGIDQDKTLNSENGYVNPPESTSKAELTAEKPLSPYPNYPDLKPPSSPTPSQPR